MEIILDQIYGTVKSKKCEWCTKLLHENRYIDGQLKHIRYLFCDKQCKEDYFDWYFISTGKNPYRYHRNTKENEHKKIKIDPKERQKQYYLDRKENLAKIRKMFELEVAKR